MEIANCDGQLYGGVLNVLQHSSVYDLRRGKNNVPALPVFYSIAMRRTLRTRHPSFPSRLPREIVTSTCTASQEIMTGTSRFVAGNIPPRKVSALARRVLREDTFVIAPCDPSSLVVANTWYRDATRIRAKIVGATGSMIPVPMLDELK